MKRPLAIFLILFAAILWGTTGTAQTFVTEEASPILIGAVRVAIGGPVLLLFAYLQGKLSLHGWKVMPVIVAALGVALYQPLFFSAVKETGVAVGTVVAIGSAPILAGLFEGVFTRKRKLPNRMWWIATFFSVIGCTILTFISSEINVTLLGIILAVGAGLSFSIYTIVTKQLLEKHESEAVIGVIFTLSAIYLLPILFIYPITPLLNPNGISVALYLGIFATGLAYLFFARGLASVPASSAITLSLAEPLTATLLGVLVVGEILAPVAWFGIFLLFIGLGTLSFSRT